MRIIGGFAKGRRLRTPPLKAGKRRPQIRPTADKAREALFDILGCRVRGASMLDLFAGTGAVGLEALSRGAGAVLFIDNNPEAFALMKKNIVTVLASGDAQKMQDRIVRVMRCDLQNVKRGPDLSGLPEELQRFDIVFADPPYSGGVGSTVNDAAGGCAAEGLALSTLDMLTTSGMMTARNSLCIIEERNTTKMPAAINGFLRSDVRVYGEAAFHFYTKK